MFDRPSRARALSRAGLLVRALHGVARPDPHRISGAAALHATPRLRLRCLLDAQPADQRPAGAPEAPRAKARGRTTAAVIDTDTTNDTAIPETPRSVVHGRTIAAVIDTDDDDGTGTPEPWSLETRDGIGAAVIGNDTEHDDDRAGRHATVNVARASGVPSARTTRTREGV